MNIKENFSIFKDITPATIVTLMNAVSGMASIWFSAAQEYTYGATFIILAVLFDFIDGKIARLMKKETKLGLELDSLADMISFGAAPAALAHAMTNGMWKGWMLWGITTIYLIFLCAGALRLARFNITKKEKIYKGMPITLNGLVIPAMYFAGLAAWYPAWFLISALLMISTFTLKKII
jgi:CDP-diacylglycerol--serine O-phosphatidyltransferase